MVAVMLSAVLSETVYELSSRVAQFERERRADALEVMKAYSDLALAAIPDRVDREAGTVEMFTADDVRESMIPAVTQPVNILQMAKDIGAGLSTNGSRKRPKVKR